MKIENSKIMNVTVKELTDTLYIEVSFKGLHHEETCGFRMMERSECMPFVMLLVHTSATDKFEQQLKGQIVRVVLNDNGNIIGFGDPIDDRFSILGNEMLEVYTLDELKKIMK